MDGHITAAPVMMQLGDFQFGISTAAYQTLERSSAWRWAQQERFGRHPALQHVGPGEETLSLPGVIFPEWRGGLGQVEAMRRLAGRGRPMLLVDGRGATMGKWVIEQLDEVQSTFAAAGMPRRVEFTLQLRQFMPADGTRIPMPPLVPAAPAQAAQAVTAAAAAVATKGAAAGYGGWLGGIAADAGAMISSAEQSARDLQAALGVASEPLQDAMGAVRRAQDVASQVREAADEARRNLGSGAGRASAIIGRLGERAAGMRRHAESAGRVLDRAAQVVGAQPWELASVVSARGGAGRIEALCRQVATDAIRLAKAANQARQEGRA